MNARSLRQPSADNRRYITMSAEESITLKEVQLRLGAPQDVLIGLCEGGVIVRDDAGASVRGKRPEFSERNVFEFAVALALRRFELPVRIIGLLVRLLHMFGRGVGKSIPGFSIPGSLVDKNIELTLSLVDADILVLQTSGGGLPEPLFLSTQVGGALSGTNMVPRIVSLDAMPSNYEARFDVNVSEIARKVAICALRK